MPAGKSLFLQQFPMTKILLQGSSTPTKETGIFRKWKEGIFIIAAVITITGGVYKVGRDMQSSISKDINGVEKRLTEKASSIKSDLSKRIDGVSGEVRQAENRLSDRIGRVETRMSDRIKESEKRLIGRIEN